MAISDPVCEYAHVVMSEPTLCACSILRSRMPLSGSISSWMHTVRSQLTEMTHLCLLQYTRRLTSPLCAAAPSSVVSLYLKA